jgi:hypothetical protein
MKSGCDKNRIKRARVFRVLAIFFLVYTGLDITVPQLCSEEFSYQEIVQVVAASDLSDQARTLPAIDAAKNSPGDPTPREHSQDEDCFCCCTHVLPGHVTAPVAIAELSPDIAALKKIDVASPVIRGPYHPPRSA